MSASSILQAIDYSLPLSAIHFPAHLATCIIRWLTHIIPELRRYLPDSLTIFQLLKKLTSKYSIRSTSLWTRIDFFLDRDSIESVAKQL